MNKIVNVNDLELETIKQMAMEIALRLNVLQGHSLIDGGTSGDQQVSTPVKRVVTENELLVGKAIMVASFVIGLIVSAACGAGALTPFFGVVATVFSLLIYAVYYKNKTNKEMQK